MVQLVIKTENILHQHKPLSKFEDYILLEFQGSLQFNSDLDLQGKELGTITQFNEKEMSIIIGNHKLYGQLVELEKPLAIIRKDKFNLKKDNNSDMMETDDLQKGKDYQLTTIIRRKILFSKRPDLITTGSYHNNTF